MRYSFLIRSHCLLWIGFLLVPDLVLAYEIGHITESFYDSSRSRTIGLEIYYPADLGGDDVPVSEGAFPVLVHGHGYTIGWSDYEYLWEGIVPEGYIMGVAKTESGILPNHLEFGKDLAYINEHFQELNDDPDFLFYRHVTSDSAILGHSMGGGASFLAIQYSPSVTVFANFAAAETNPSAIVAAANISIPALLFSGTEDCVTPAEDHQIPMYNALQSDCKTRITITGGSHCQFAQNNFTCTLGEVFAGCSADISLETQETLTLQFLIPWLDYMLKEDVASWQEFQLALASGAGSGVITYTQDCFMPTPTPSATPESTRTPTPVPSATMTPTSTPTYTPTYICSEPSVELIMPSSYFIPKDTFYLNAELCNPDEQVYGDTPLFIILDVYGIFYYWPDWTQIPTYELIDLRQGRELLHILNPFEWPEGAGQAQGIVFYGAMTNQDLTEIFGSFSMITFGWGDE